jgi:retinol dehydrogenase-12
MADLAGTTFLLLEHLRASAPARIVNVASEGHYRAPGIDFSAVRAPTRTPSRGRSAR